MIGTTVQHYDILEQLGSGGMGVVYKAWDTKLDRHVALKFLPADLSRDEEANQRFVQEAKAASGLNHPNICTIHEIGETDDGRLFIAMSLYEGQTLKTILEQAPLSPDQTLDIVRQIASGLAAAHEKGIVHRDIKPANLFIDEKGRAVILDFGLAKLAGSAALTRTGSTLGTISYMSPEQAQGGDVDHRTDIWSLGSVFYEMLCGRKPFQGEFDQAIVYNILNTEPEPVSQANPSVPAELGLIVQKALARDRQVRYGSINEFLTALQQDEFDGQRRVRLPLRLPRPAMYAVLAVVVALVAASFFTWHFGSRESIDSIAVLPLVNLSDDAGQGYFTDGMTEALIGTLSRMSAIRVISRQSIMGYKGSDKTVPQIAAELGVDAIVEGSVIRQGNTVRIRAGLVSAKTDQSLWSDEFDREFKDILALHKDIATSIADGIQITLTDQEKRRFATTEAVDPEAYEAYLKGDFHWYKFTPEDLALAVDYFTLAIEKDSTYAPAYAGLADALATPAHLGLIPPVDVYPRAKQLLRKALELDRDHERIQDLYARILWAYDWDWHNAEAGFKRSIRINANYPDVHAVYSQLLSARGETAAALEHARTARDLDPLNSWFPLELGARLSEAGRYEEGIPILQEVLRREPVPAGYHYLWQAAFGAGRYDLAIEAVSEMYALYGDDELVASLRGGRSRDEYVAATLRAAEILEARADSVYVSRKSIAELLAHAGEARRALEWLQRSADMNESNLVYIISSPSFGLVRTDSAYGTLLARMNVPPL